MGVPYFGVLIIRILPFRVLYWGPLLNPKPQSLYRTPIDPFKEPFKGTLGSPCFRKLPNASFTRYERTGLGFYNAARLLGLGPPETPRVPLKGSIRVP